MIKGVVRLFDKLGRITIPMEMRRTLKLNEGDPVDIYIQNGIICIKPAKVQCVICGTEEKDNNLVEKNGVLVCKSCVNELSSITRR